MALLKQVRRPRKILLHVNNTNPILDRDSSEHRQVLEAGWEIAEDGWDIQLWKKQASSITRPPRFSDSSELLTREQLLGKLHAIGAERYHHRHPFHLLMHEGKLTRGQMQAWALNRYYYQSDPDQGLDHPVAQP